LQNNTITHLYNPANQTKEQLIDGFIARQKEFTRLMKELNQSKLDEVSQNYLITAQRGMGKTTLLLRLEHAIIDEPKLNHLIPLRFTEEQYNIVSFCNLWEVVAESLDEMNGFKGVADALEQQIENDDTGCFNVIKKALKHNNKKLVLLIDNFQDILKKFSDNEIKSLRDLLHSTELQLISSSSVAIDNTYRHDKPFFEFFKNITLEGLSKEDSQALFAKLASKPQEEINAYDASRIEIIRRLTGGVPRTMIIIFQIFLDKNAEIFDNLEYILDQVTPLYKHRMDDLPSKAQRVAHTIALAWDGISFEELKSKTRENEEQLKSHLLELDKAYFIETTYVNKEIELYQLKERFFNIWYLMRNGKRKNKEHVIWLVKFLEIWCTPNELEKRALIHINLLKQQKINPKGALYMAEALGELLEDYQLKEKLQYETKEYLEMTSPELAKAFYIKDSSKNINKYFTLGNDYTKKKEYDKAIEAYQKAIEINPNNAWAYNNMGLCFYHKKEYDKAIEAYQKAIELDPNYARAYNNMGLCFYHKKEYDKAIEAYQKAIELDPNYAKAYNNMGLCFYHKKEYDKAIKAYQKAIELVPNYARAYRHMGIINAYKKEYDKAIEAYQKAIELDPNYALAYDNIGNSYYEKKEYDKAIEVYQKAIELDPNYTRAYNSLAWLYFEQKINNTEALNLAKKGFNLDKTSIYIIHTYAMILLWNNKYNESLLTIKAIIENKEYLNFLNDIRDYFILLIAKEQYKELYKLFEIFPKLKIEFKPVYYALMFFMQDIYPTEYKRMGSELKDTVKEIINRVKRMKAEYNIC